MITERIKEYSKLFGAPLHGFNTNIKYFGPLLTYATHIAYIKKTLTLFKLPDQKEALLHQCKRGHNV